MSSQFCVPFGFDLGLSLREKRAEDSSRDQVVFRVKHLFEPGGSRLRNPCFLETVMLIELERNFSLGRSSYSDGHQSGTAGYSLDHLILKLNFVFRPLLPLDQNVPVLTINCIDSSHSLNYLRHISLPPLKLSSSSPALYTRNLYTTAREGQKNIN